MTSIEKKLNPNGGLSTEKFLSYVREGKEEDVKQILSANSLLVTRVGFYGKTALFHAIVCGSLVMVELLLEKGANVDQTSFVSYHRDRLISCDEPPLVTTARLGEVKMLTRLLKYGADVNKSSQFHPQHTGCKVPDRAALHFACEDGNLELVQVLIKHNADVNQLDKRKEQPLHLAARCRSIAAACDNQVAIVRLLCEQGSDVNFTTSIDCTALYLAAFYACEKKARVLLSHGADPNLRCDRDNSFGSPLHIASMKDRCSFAELLIKHDADLNLVNAAGYTALQLNLTMYSQSQVAWVLVYQGAQLNTVDKCNLTLMACLIRNMRLDCETLAKFLVFAGYDLRNDLWLKGKESTDDEAKMLEIEIPEGRMTDLCDWLRERQRQPMALSEICRTLVRQHTMEIYNGRSIIAALAALPLPSAIIDYLLLTDVYLLSHNLSTLKSI